MRKLRLIRGHSSLIVCINSNDNSDPSSIPTITDLFSFTCDDCRSISLSLFNQKDMYFS